jgi:hypothetical protein
VRLLDHATRLVPGTDTRLCVEWFVVPAMRQVFMAILAGYSICQLSVSTTQPGLRCYRDSALDDWYYEGVRRGHTQQSLLQTCGSGSSGAISLERRGIGQCSNVFGRLIDCDYHDRSSAWRCRACAFKFNYGRALQGDVHGRSDRSLGSAPFPSPSADGFYLQTPEHSYGLLHRSPGSLNTLSSFTTFLRLQTARAPGSQRLP